MSNSTRPCPWPLTAEAIGDHIIYTHSPIWALSGVETDKASQRERGNSIKTRVVDVTGANLKKGSSHAGEGQKCEKESGENSRSDGKHLLPNLSDGGSKSSFALVTVLSEPLDASIDAILVQPPSATQPGAIADEEAFEKKSAGVSIILGPVVGKIEVVASSGGKRESCRVPVVVEVDRNAIVTCVVSLRRMKNTHEANAISQDRA